MIAVTGAIVCITGNSGAWRNRDREALKDFRIRWLSGGGRPEVALGPYSGAAIHDDTVCQAGDHANFKDNRVAERRRQGATAC